MQKITLGILLTLLTFSGIAQVRDSIVLHTATGDIFGTLTLPSNNKKAWDAVVLVIPGSGPTDRDGNNGVFVNNTLRMFSDSLALHGIASLRFDKRGLAASEKAVKGESELRFDTYGDDAAAWIHMLKKDKRFKKVFVAGHSEGSLVGMLALQKENAAGFISIAGTAEPADVMITRQLSWNPNNPKVMVDSMLLIMDSLKKYGHYDHVPSGIYQMLFRPSVQGYVASWFKFDPREEIKKLKLPILLIQGKKDLQMDTIQALNLKAAQPKAELVFLPLMNHIFRDVESNTPQLNMATYSNTEEPIDSQFVEAVVKFVQEHSGK